MLQRIKSTTTFAAIPFILLVTATGQIGIVKAWDGYWGSSWGGAGYYQSSCGYNCGQAYWDGRNYGWYWQVRQTGYSQGFIDGSQNLSYDCSGHGTVYCASYSHGYTNGQAQYNQQNDNSGNQQSQESSSTSYIQSNPHIVINNIIPGGNRLAENSGPGTQGADPN